MLAGQNHNHWINLSVSGSVSNKAAIGARIKVTLITEGEPTFTTFALAPLDYVSRGLGLISCSPK